MELSEALRKSYFSHGMSDATLSDLASITVTQICADGDTLMRASDPGADLLLVLEGKVRINTSAGDRIVYVGPGDMIGEIALLDDGPRSATVVSVGASVVGILSAEKLRTLMQEHPDVELTILRNLSKVLCSRLRNTNVKMERFLFLLG